MSYLLNMDMKFLLLSIDGAGIEFMLKFFRFEKLCTLDAYISHKNSLPNKQKKSKKDSKTMKYDIIEPSSALKIKTVLEYATPMLWMVSLV